MDPIDPWLDSAEVKKLAESLLRPVHVEPTSKADPGFGERFVGFAGADVVADKRPATPEPEPEPEPEPADEVIEEPVVPAHVQTQARQALAGARQRAVTGGLLERPEEWSVPPASPPPSPPAPEQVARAVAPAATPVAPVATAPPEQPPSPPGPTSAPFIERLHAFGAWLRESVQAKAFFVSDRDGQVLIDQVRSPKLLQVARTLAQASHSANRQAGGSAVGSLHVKLGAESILEVLPVFTDYGPLVLGIVVPQVMNSAAIPVISSGLKQVVDGNPR